MEFEELGPEEATIFRGLAARINFLSLDNPDLQFPAKVCSEDMAKPSRGSWKMKKVAWYLAGCGRVVWNFGWQDEPKFCQVFSGSDWGGTLRDRKSASGGVWMLVGRSLHEDVERKSRGICTQ